MKQGLVYSYPQQDPQYKGEPFESSLAQGPTQDRKCRDCFCLLLYIAFWVGLIAVAIIAFSNGQPHLLASPFDSTGQQCGYSPGYQNYPYGYFNQRNTSQFACINTCPTSGLTQSSECYFNNTQLNCSQFGNYSTTTFVGICYPQSDIIAQTINLGIGFYQESISDMQITWPISLSIVFITLILSLLLMTLVRYCGGCLVIGTIIIYFASIITIGVVFLLTAQGQIQIVGLDDLDDPTLLYVISGVAFAIGAISFLVLLCSIRKIKIGIMVLKATAQFTQQQFQTILVPIFMFFAIAVFIAFWVTVSIFIFSSGTIGSCNGSPYACIDWNTGVRRSLGFYLFGLFWNCQVAIGMCQFVIASTASYWYFSHGKNKEEVSSPVCKSFGRALFYHLGSIAFGALILCILWILQILLQLLHSCVKQKTVAGDPVTGACASCCISYARCCLACFQRFVRFISHNAFIMMAITGEGFCTSAHQAFYLILRSSAEYAITHGVGHLIMFFGKLLIATLCTLAGYFMITQISYFSSQLFTPVFPTIIFFVISFVIGSIFMDVFGIGSDTLLLCYCLEKDILRGVSRCCPQTLKATLDN